MNITQLPIEILHFVDDYLDIVGRDTLASTCKSLHKDLSVLPAKEVPLFFIKNGIYYLKGRALSAPIYFTTNYTHIWSDEPRILTPAQRFSYIIYSRGANHILYESIDIGYHPTFLTKEEYDICKDIYYETQSKIFEERRKKLEEQQKKEEEEEQRIFEAKKHSRFIIKGNAKPTNPWKKI